MKISIGLSEEAVTVSMQALKQYLADSLVLYVKTQGCHWNVVSSDFGPLHELFQKQYEDLADANDETAERMRSLGQWAPSTIPAILESKTLSDFDSSEQPDMVMVQALLSDHESMCQFLRTAIPSVQSGGDEVTADYFIERLTVHEKTAWFLRSTLAKG